MERARKGTAQTAMAERTFLDVPGIQLTHGLKLGLCLTIQDVF